MKISNKMLCKFVRTGKNRVSKKTETVTKFTPELHENTNVDSFGRVVHGMAVSSTHYIMTTDEKREFSKRDVAADEFSGIYASVVMSDPAMIIEMMDIAGLEFNA